MTSFFATIVMGFVIGLVLLSLGGGGGAYYLGVLTSIFQLPPATAAATSIVTAFPALVLGCWNYYRKGLINFRLGWRMLVAAIPSIFVGYFISPYLPDKLYKVIIGLILLCLGIQIIYESRQGGQSKKGSKLSPTAACILYGVLAGLMVGIAGLSGGGAITAGLIVMGVSLAKMSATSSFVLVGMSLVGGLLHISGGHVDWQAASGLIIGSLIGAVFAPSLALWFSRDAKRSLVIKVILGIVLIIMGIKTAWVF